jgi:MFS family permease
MIIDMTYINRRAKAIAFMWCFAGAFGTSAVALVPVITNNGHEWRQFYRWWTIPVVISLFVSFALYPETYFKRPTVAFDGLIVLQSATEKLTIFQDIEAGSDIYRDLPEYPLRTGFAGLRDRLGLSRSPFASWASMGRCYLQMAYCAANPLIFWVFVASAANSASMIFIGATYARVLTAPPYNMPGEVVGTVNVASGIGAVIGFLVWCFIICKVVTKLSKRNHGVYEAEHYLVGYILPIITGALSTLLYGFTVGNNWHPAGIYVAYGMNGLAFVTLMIANTLWVAEAFPRWAAPALAVVSGGCYLLTFAVSFALGPWIDAHGYKWVGIEIALFELMGGLIAMPVAFWGKSMRQAIQGRWADDRSGALRPV